MLRHEETESRSISVRSSFESGAIYCPIQARLDKFDGIRQLDEVVGKQDMLLSFLLLLKIQNICISLELPQKEGYTPLLFV